MSQGFELYIVAHTDFSGSTETSRMEMVIEKLFYSPLKHMTRLLAREYLTDMSNYLRFYAPLTPQKANIWLRYKLSSS